MPGSRPAAAPPRAGLPTDPATVPPIDPGFMVTLASGLAELGLSLDTAILDAFAAQARLLAVWAGAINLTAIRDPAQVARLHVLDSLAAVPVLREVAGAGASLLDLGSGAGYPGIPLALALPAGRAMVVDSVAKKVRFLAVAIDAVTSSLASAGLPVPALVARTARAEDLAAQPGQRGSWDLVTARAVGSLTEVLELGLPLAVRGGHVVAWKREHPDARLALEVADAAVIGRAAGGGTPRVVDAGLRDLPGHRLVVVRKERDTPARYPRPPAERSASARGR